MSRYPFTLRLIRISSRFLTGYGPRLLVKANHITSDITIWRSCSTRVFSSSRPLRPSHLRRLVPCVPRSVFRRLVPCVFRRLVPCVFRRLVPCVFRRLVPCVPRVTIVLALIDHHLSLFSRPHSSCLQSNSTTSLCSKVQQIFLSGSGLSFKFFKPRATGRT